MSTPPKVYLETTIASYLTAWPSRDLVMAANQEITREWWANRKDAFDLFVSQTVIKEAKMPDTIIQEIRKTRDDYARQFNYDLHQMCLDLRREQELSGAKVVTFSSKSTQPSIAQPSNPADVRNGLAQGGESTAARG
ncbi:MAG: hypothetical protein HYV60_24420 [Planctomycetia bacterium]|nr:hypothetical protein [Planctomycetia bacterium]